mmetsp:Transcript_7555/g.14062  ORF Transcript_7555/g.14062 Transcript_7555/m.14062 type:complete len:385 (+) Transcript_7555:4650-5804(+)
MAEARSSKHIEPVAQPIPDELNRLTYQTQKHCRVCVRELASHVISGLTTNKRYFCKFCYFAVCDACSQHRLVHPETATPERICEHCYFRYLEDTVRAGIQGELEVARSKLEEVKVELHKEHVQADEERLQVKQLEAKLQAMESEAEKRFTAMRQSLQKHQKECDDIKRATERLEEELKLANTEFIKENLKRNEAKQKLAQVKSSLEQQRTKLASKRANLAQSQDEGMRIRHLIDEKANSLTPADQKRQLQEKKRAIKKLQRDKADLEKEIADLKDEIENADETLDTKESAISQLKTELSENANSKANAHKVQWDEVQMLKEKVLLLKKENEALRVHNLEGQAADLRRELQKKQEDNAMLRRKLNESVAHSVTPIDSKKCDCIVF